MNSMYNSEKKQQQQQRQITKAPQRFKRRCSIYYLNLILDLLVEKKGFLEPGTLNVFIVELFSFFI